MNALRSWAVIYGLAVVLGLPGKALANNNAGETFELGTITSLFAWVTVGVIGAQIAWVVFMMIRGTYVRKKDRTQRKAARAGHVS